MEIYHLKELPEGFKEYTSEEIAFDEPIFQDIDVVAYWYGAGYYEGAGEMILQKEGEWFVHDMGHCSCYGPTCSLEFKRPFNNLDEIVRVCSTEYLGEVGPLIDLLKSHGYK